MRIDPNSVRWNYDSKVKTFESVGGKVIQVFGTTLGNMTIEGSFGIGGWQQQVEFLKAMKAIGVEQSEDNMSQHNKPPLRFTYPPKGWDFMVYLRDFSSPDGPEAVNMSPAIFNPKWTLTLFLAEDNANLTELATNAYISRLSKGIGWKQSEFNGPLEDAAAPTSPVFGNTIGTGEFSQDVLRWQPLVNKYFPQEYRIQALKIIQCESEGNPNARNPKKTQQYGHAKGLFQHLENLWLSRSALAGFPGADIFNPEANVGTAYWLFAQTNTWQHWACRRVVPENAGIYGVGS